MRGSIRSAAKATCFFALWALSSCEAPTSESSLTYSLELKVSLGSLATGGVASTERTIELVFAEETEILSNRGYRLVLVPTFLEARPMPAGWYSGGASGNRVKLDFRLIEEESGTSVMTFTKWAHDGDHFKGNTVRADGVPSPTDIQYEGMLRFPQTAV